jgi:hypothetical protein
MSSAPVEVETAIELQVRITCAYDPKRQARVLELLRKRGGSLKAHLLYKLGEQLVGLFLCEKPAEAALALKTSGLDVDTETAVTITTEDRAGAFAFLLQTLAAEGIAVGYSYSTAADGKLRAVLRTDDNPKAEDILRKLLVLRDEGDADQHLSS